MLKIENKNHLEFSTGPSGGKSTWLAHQALTKCINSFDENVLIYAPHEATSVYFASILRKLIIDSDIDDSSCTAASNGYHFSLPMNCSIHVVNRSFTYPNPLVGYNPTLICVDNIDHLKDDTINDLFTKSFLSDCTILATRTTMKA